MLTAYATYNGALSGGDAMKGYTASSRTRADANGEHGDHSQTFSADRAVFLHYQILVEQGLDDTATDASLALPEGEGPSTRSPRTST